MSPSVKSLGIDQLSVDDRIRLVEEIWDGIADSVQSMEIPQSHKEELDRRLAAMEADPHAGSSWEDVKARLQTGLDAGTEGEAIEVATRRHAELTSGAVVGCTHDEVMKAARRALQGMAKSSYRAR